MRVIMTQVPADLGQPFSAHSLIKQYLQRIRNTRRPNTHRHYTASLKVLYRYMQQRKLVSLKSVDERFITSFLQHISAGRNSGGKAAVLRPIKAFLGWADKHKERPPDWRNPRSGIPIDTRTQPKVYVATSEQIRALLATCKSSSFADVRDRALLHLLTYTGARASEIINLRRENLDIAGCVAELQQSKDGASRFVNFPPKTARVLRDLQAVSKPSCEFVFQSVRGEKLTYSGFRQVLRRRGVQANLGPRISAHGFRRRYATRLMAADTGIAIVQRMMGHKSLHVLNRYLHLVNEDVQKIYNRKSKVLNF